MQEVIQVLKENNVLHQAIIMNKNFFLFDKRFDSEIYTQKRENFTIHCSSSLNKQCAQNIRDGLCKLGLNIDLVQQILEGQKIPLYKDLHRVFVEQKTELKYKHGQVLLIEVWATWSKASQISMQHNQALLEKNEDSWKEKVRIVAVSVDERKDIIQQRVNEKGWNKIEHLTLLGWNVDSPMIKNFNIQGIPFVLIVDTEGEIDYIGSPSQINLQERINRLLEKDVTHNETKLEANQDNSFEDLIESLKKLQHLKNAISQKILENKFKEVDLFSVKCDGQVRIQKGRLQKSQVNLKVSTYEDTPEVIEQFKGILSNIDPTLYTLQEYLVKFEQQPDIMNQQCTVCKAKIQYPCYWCKWDQDSNTFRCRQCVQKKQIQEEKHYSYNKNCILLTGPWKRIAIKSLGANLQPENIDKVKSPHQFSCNSCQYCPKKINESRYICLACRSDPKYRHDYIDICQLCSINYFKGDQKVKAALHNDGHRQNHPLLRILYNVEGYYKF